MFLGIAFHNNFFISTTSRKRDEELGIRQQELQLEHRHAQLKEELNMRLSCNSKYSMTAVCLFPQSLIA